MATWDDVRRLVAELPEADEGTSYGNLAWKVKGKLMVWERALRGIDLAALGDSARDGEILGAAGVCGRPDQVVGSGRCGPM